MGRDSNGKQGDTNLRKGNSKTSAVGRSGIDGLARQYVGQSVGSKGK